MPFQALSSSLARALPSFPLGPLTPSCRLRLSATELHKAAQSQCYRNFSQPGKGPTTSDFSLHCFTSCLLTKSLAYRGQNSPPSNFFGGVISRGWAIHSTSPLEIMRTVQGPTVPRHHQEEAEKGRWPTKHRDSSPAPFVNSRIRRRGLGGKDASAILSGLTYLPSQKTLMDQPTNPGRIFLRDTL